MRTEEKKTGCILVPMFLALVGVLLFGMIKEDFLKSQGYDKKVEIINISTSKDNRYIFVYLSNNEVIQANRFWESYQFQIGDSIFIRHNEEGKPIYAGNPNGVPGNR